MAMSAQPAIAVIGAAVRLPGCRSVREFLRLVREGGSQIGPVHPDDRAYLHFAGDPDEPDYVDSRGSLQDMFRFDHAAFRISAYDAALMDPQHRILLETAHQALEDAEHRPDSRGGLRTGVFVSGSPSGYLRALIQSARLDPAALDTALHGCEPDFLAGLLAYKLDLTGPAMTVQSACSSSLVALHLAVSALERMDCDQALVAGVGIGFPQSGHWYLEGGIKSRAGRCRPFDAAADGVVEGSGAVALVLRRAERMDPLAPAPYGFVLGTAVGNDGRQKMSFNAPSPEGQERTIRAALQRSGLPATAIGYLEAHGTGTRIGDPIEWEAADAAYRALGARRHQIAVGAVKGSIGHIDGAAGLAGCLKSVLVAASGCVPPLAGFASPNPLLDAENSVLRLPERLAPWPEDCPRAAGVSAFGVGGTNAHAIVLGNPAAAPDLMEQAPGPDAEDPGAAASWIPLPLSAHTAEALQELADSWADRLDPLGHGQARALAASLATRDHKPVGQLFWGRDGRELAAQIRSAPRLGPGHCTAPARAPSAQAARLAFLYPGQGSQYPGMARPWATLMAGFQDHLEDLLQALPPELRAGVRALLLDPAAPQALVEDTATVQPALFVLGCAATKALAEAGIQPHACLGHSLGEFAALVTGGVLSPRQASDFVVARGAAMAACPDGAMLAVAMTAADALAHVTALDLDVEIAAINGPVATTLAGTPAAIEEVRASLPAHVRRRLLPGRRAFHSQLIDPALPDLHRLASGLGPMAARMPIALNVDGTLLMPGQGLNPRRLSDQARQPVLFHAACQSLQQAMPGIIAVEIGPGSALSSLWEAGGSTAIALASGAGAAGDPLVALQTGLGALFADGHASTLAARLTAGVRRARGPLCPFAGPTVIHGAILDTAHRSEADGRFAAVPAAAPARDGAAPPPGMPPGATTGASEDGLPPGQDTVPGPPDEPAVAVAPALAAVWRTFLGTAPDSPDADFFDLGGESLALVRMTRHLQDVLHIEIRARDLMTRSRFADQLALLETLTAGRADASQV